MADKRDAFLDREAVEEDSEGNVMQPSNEEEEDPEEAARRKEMADFINDDDDEPDSDVDANGFPIHGDPLGGGSADYIAEPEGPPQLSRLKKAADKDNTLAQQKINSLGLLEAAANRPMSDFLNVDSNLDVPGSAGGISSDQHMNMVHPGGLIMGAGSLQQGGATSSRAPRVAIGDDDIDNTDDDEDGFIAFTEEEKAQRKEARRRKREAQQAMKENRAVQMTEDQKKELLEMFGGLDGVGEDEDDLKDVLDPNEIWLKEGNEQLQLHKLPPEEREKLTGSPRVKAVKISEKEMLKGDEPTNYTRKYQLALQATEKASSRQRESPELRFLFRSWWDKILRKSGMPERLFFRYYERFEQGFMKILKEKVPRTDGPQAAKKGDKKASSADKYRDLTIAEADERASKQLWVTFTETELVWETIWISKQYRFSGSGDGQDSEVASGSTHQTFQQYLKDTADTGAGTSSSGGRKSCWALVKEVLYMLHGMCDHHSYEPATIKNHFGWRLVGGSGGFKRTSDLDFIFRKDLEWQKVFMKLLEYEELVRQVTKATLFLPKDIMLIQTHHLPNFLDDHLEEDYALREEVDKRYQDYEHQMRRAQQVGGHLTQMGNVTGGHLTQMGMTPAGGRGGKRLYGHMGNTPGITGMGGFSNVSGIMDNDNVSEGGLSGVSQHQDWNGAQTEVGFGEDDEVSMFGGTPGFEGAGGNGDADGGGGLTPAFDFSGGAGGVTPTPFVKVAATGKRAHLQHLQGKKMIHQQVMQRYDAAATPAFGGGDQDGGASRTGHHTPGGHHTPAANMGTETPAGALAESVGGGARTPNQGGGATPAGAMPGAAGYERELALEAGRDGELQFASPYDATLNKQRDLRIHVTIEQESTLGIWMSPKKLPSCMPRLIASMCHAEHSHELLEYLGRCVRFIRCWYGVDHHDSKPAYGAKALYKWEVPKRHWALVQALGLDRTQKQFDEPITDWEKYDEHVQNSAPTNPLQTLTCSPLLMGRRFHDLFTSCGWWNDRKVLEVKNAFCRNEDYVRECYHHADRHNWYGLGKVLYTKMYEECKVPQVKCSLSPAKVYERLWISITPGAFDPEQPQKNPTGLRATKEALEALQHDVEQTYLQFAKTEVRVIEDFSMLQRMMTFVYTKPKPHIVEDVRYMHEAWYSVCLPLEELLQNGELVKQVFIAERQNLCEIKYFLAVRESTPDEDLRDAQKDALPSFLDYYCWDKWVPRSTVMKTCPSVLLKMMREGAAAFPDEFEEMDMVAKMNAQRLWKCAKEYAEAPATWAPLKSKQKFNDAGKERADFQVKLIKEERKQNAGAANAGANAAEAEQGAKSPGGVIDNAGDRDALANALKTRRGDEPNIEHEEIIDLYKKEAAVNLEKAQKVEAETLRLFRMLVSRLARKDEDAAADKEGQKNSSYDSYNKDYYNNDEEKQEQKTTEFLDCRYWNDPKNREVEKVPLVLMRGKAQDIPEGDRARAEVEASPFQLYFEASCCENRMYGLDRTKYFNMVQAERRGERVREENKPKLDPRMLAAEYQPWWETKFEIGYPKHVDEKTHTTRNAATGRMRVLNSHLIAKADPLFSLLHKLFFPDVFDSATQDDAWTPLRKSVLFTLCEGLVDFCWEQLRNEVRTAGREALQRDVSKKFATLLNQKPPLPRLKRDVAIPELMELKKQEQQKEHEVPLHRLKEQEIMRKGNDDYQKTRLQASRGNSDPLYPGYSPLHAGVKVLALYADEQSAVDVDALKLDSGKSMNVANISTREILQNFYFVALDEFGRLLEQGILTIGKEDHSWLSELLDAGEHLNLSGLTGGYKLFHRMVKTHLPGLVVLGGPQSLITGERVRLNKGTGKGGSKKQTLRDYQFKFEKILDSIAETTNGMDTPYGDGWGVGTSDPLNPFAANADVHHEDGYQEKKSGPGQVRIDKSADYDSWWPKDLEGDSIWAEEMQNDTKTGITIVKIGTNIESLEDPIDLYLKNSSGEFTKIDFKETCKQKLHKDERKMFMFGSGRDHHRYTDWETDRTPLDKRVGLDRNGYWYVRKDPDGTWRDPDLNYPERPWGWINDAREKKRVELAGKPNNSAEKRALIGWTAGTPQNFFEKELGMAPKWRPEVRICDMRIPRVFGSSAANKLELTAPHLRDDGFTMASAKPPGVKVCLSMARYQQEPLAEALSLWHEHPDHCLLLDVIVAGHQKFCDRKQLHASLERSVIDLVCSMGLCLNRLKRNPNLQSLAQFLPGLGPRKASALFEAMPTTGVAGQKVHSAGGLEVRVKPFEQLQSIMGKLFGPPNGEQPDDALAGLVQEERLDPDRSCFINHHLQELDDAIEDLSAEMMTLSVQGRNLRKNKDENYGSHLGGMNRHDLLLGATPADAGGSASRAAVGSVPNEGMSANSMAMSAVGGEQLGLSRMNETARKEEIDELKQEQDAKEKEFLKQANRFQALELLSGKQELIGKYLQGADDVDAEQAASFQRKIRRRFPGFGSRDTAEEVYFQRWRGEASDVWQNLKKFVQLSDDHEGGGLGKLQALFSDNEQLQELAFTICLQWYTRMYVKNKGWFLKKMEFELVPDPEGNKKDRRTGLRMREMLATDLVQLTLQYRSLWELTRWDCDEWTGLVDQITSFHNPLMRIPFLLQQDPTGGVGVWAAEAAAQAAIEDDGPDQQGAKDVEMRDANEDENAATAGGEGGHDVEGVLGTSAKNKKMKKISRENLEAVASKDQSSQFVAKQVKEEWVKKILEPAIKNGGLVDARADYKGITVADYFDLVLNLAGELKQGRLVQAVVKRVSARRRPVPGFEKGFKTGGPDKDVEAMEGILKLTDYGSSDGPSAEEVLSMKRQKYEVDEYEIELQTSNKIHKIIPAYMQVFNKTESYKYKSDEPVMVMIKTVDWGKLEKGRLPRSENTFRGVIGRGALPEIICTDYYDRKWGLKPDVNTIPLVDYSAEKAPPCPIVLGSLRPREDMGVSGKLVTLEEARIHLQAAPEGSKIRNAELRALGALVPAILPRRHAVEMEQKNALRQRQLLQYRQPRNVYHDSYITGSNDQLYDWLASQDQGSCLFRHSETSPFLIGYFKFSDCLTEPVRVEDRREDAPDVRRVKHLQQPDLLAANANGDLGGSSGSGKSSSTNADQVLQHWIRPIYIREEWEPHIRAVDRTGLGSTLFVRVGGFNVPFSDLDHFLATYVEPLKEKIRDAKAMTGPAAGPTIKAHRKWDARASKPLHLRDPVKFRHETFTKSDAGLLEATKAEFKHEINHGKENSFYCRFQWDHRTSGQLLLIWAFHYAQVNVEHVTVDHDGFRLWNNQLHKDESNLEVWPPFKTLDKLYKWFVRGFDGRNPGWQISATCRRRWQRFVEAEKDIVRKLAGLPEAMALAGDGVWKHPDVAHTDKRRAELMERERQRRQDNYDYDGGAGAAGEYMELFVDRSGPEDQVPMLEDVRHHGATSSGGVSTRGGPFGGRTTGHTAYNDPTPGSYTPGYGPDGMTPAGGVGGGGRRAQPYDPLRGSRSVNSYHAYTPVNMENYSYTPAGDFSSVVGGTPGAEGVSPGISAGLSPGTPGAFVSPGDATYFGQDANVALSQARRDVASASAAQGALTPANAVGGKVSSPKANGK